MASKDWLMHKELSANDLGSLAAQILKEAARSEIVGEIVSIFPNSLYIKTTNGELIFVTGRQLRSPVTVNIDPRIDFSQIVRPQDKVSLDEDELHLGESLSVKLSQATPCIAHTTSRPHHLAITEATLHLASLILMMIDNNLSVLDQAGIAHTGVSKFVSEGIFAFRRSKDVNLFRNAAKRIVGLGTGFTPSGDDLLGGFLATYNYFTQVTSRQTINLGFESLENRTNWISAKLLDYMQREILDEQMSMLIESSASQGSDTFILALETMLPRGHTSGIDILVGALLALSVIHDIARNDDVTTVIAKNLSLVA
jgi:uncharacterized protein DUF2877